MADRAIAETTVSDTDSLVSFREQFIEDELVHAVIQWAVLSRAQIDDMNKPRFDPSELSFKPIQQRNCGMLTEVVGASGGEPPLNFWEACNKTPVP